MPGYKAVIFDLDGTLLDTVADIADAVNLTLEQYGWAAQPIERYRVLVGAGLDELLELILGRHAEDQAFFQAFRDKVVMYYTQRMTSKTRPYSGIEPILQQLQEWQTPKAVLSNKEHEKANHVVNHFFSAKQLAPVVGAQAGVPVKPDPTNAYNIADELGFAPSDILYVGDTPTDIQTARRAGMLPLGVEWGFRPKEELWQEGAHTILAHPEELLNFFRSGR
jgi:phosphoglycolate phosphatase